MPLNRAWLNGLVDDDGSGTTGTPWNKSAVSTFHDVIDAALLPIESGSTVPIHASRHKAGGADPIALDTLAAPSDVLTLNATTTAHGLLPKLPGGTTLFLRGDGTYAAPPGGGGSGNVTGPATSVVGHVASFNNTTGTLLADAAANVVIPGTLSIGSAPTPTGNIKIGIPINGQIDMGGQGNISCDTAIMYLASGGPFVLMAAWGAQQYFFSSTAFYPNTGGTFPSLGTATQKFTDLYLSGQVNAAGLGSTPINATNITSGTLPDARLSGNVLKYTGGYPGGTTTFLRADGAFAAPPGGGGGTPGGSTTQVQFNDAGAFGGDAGLTYDKATDALTVAGFLAVGASPATTGTIRMTTNTNLMWPDGSQVNNVNLFGFQLIGDSIALSVGAGGSTQYRVDSTAFYPMTDAAKDFGIASTNRWRHAYFSGSVSIGTNPSGSGAVRLPNNSAISFRNAANSGNVDAIFFDNNNAVLLGAGAAYCLFQSNILVSPTATYDIGSSGLRFKDLYLSGNVNAAGLGTTPARKVITNTQTGTINDWAPAGLSGNTVIEWDGGSANLTVTGLAGGSAGQIVTFRGASSGFYLFFAHASAASVAANRFTNVATSGATGIAAQGWATFLHDGTNWKLIDHEQGGWINVTFNAADFTGNGAMTWTVEAGDCRSYRYRLAGRTLLFEGIFLTTTTGGTASTALQVKIPNGFTALAIEYTGSNFHKDGGMAGYGMGAAWSPQSAGYISFWKYDFGTTSWALGTNNVNVYSNIVLEVL